MSENDENLVQLPSPDELTKETRAFWRDVGRATVRNSVKTLDETAKQIIGVTGILEGLYFHAITYSDLRGQASGGMLVIYVAPVVLLLLSLVAALAVFLPDRYRLNVHSAEAAQVVHRRVVGGKLLALRVAAAFLILGVSAVGAAVVAYLVGS
jgi:hypothetical protein